MMKKSLRFAFALLTCTSLGSCALVGGPADLERASGYTYAAPGGWDRRGRGESDRAFALPSGNVVSLVSSCNRNPDAPLDVLTRHLLIGTRQVKILSRAKTKFGENEGLHSKIVATLEGKPFHLELFVLAKDKCVFDFSLISPKEIPASDSKAFETFIASFHYGKN
jgi:hypothetical protein